MTVQEIVLDLLSYANVYGFELGGVPEDETEIVRAVAGVNHAIQDIYRYGPTSLKYDTRSSYLNVPTSITLALTQGAKTAVKTGTVFDAWMRGCSAQIDGDSILNRIVDIVAGETTTTFTFQRPYLGATGSHSVLVYGDCVLLDSDVAAVLEPVILAPNTRLVPAQTKAGFLRSFYWSCPISGRRCWYIPFYTVWEKVTGTPQNYRVEQRKDSATIGGGSLYLGLNPMPTLDTTLSYDVYRRPVPIKRTDLDESGGDDPEVPIAAIPADMIESFLLPIARWKYVAAHPEAKIGEKNSTLKTGYDEAMTNLRNGACLAPQINVTRARYL